jgi:hypothetical protein
MLAEPNADREAALLRARQAGEALARAASVMDPRAMAMLSRSDPRRTEYEKAVAADQEAKRVVEEATRAAAPPPPSPRDALVAAVAKLKAAKTELIAARDAKAKNAAEIGEAVHVESEINGAIEKAQHEASVGALPARDAAELIAQKRLMLGSTREHIAILRDKDTGFEVRLKRATDGVDMAQIRFDRCRAAYLREHPAVIGLLQRYDRLQREVLGVGQVLDLVEKAGGLSAHWRARVPAPSIVPEEISKLAAQWRSAIAALEGDVDAPLPT